MNGLISPAGGERKKHVYITGKRNERNIAGENTEEELEKI